MRIREADELRHKKEPYAVPRFAKSSIHGMVWRFNYLTMEYDRLLSESRYNDSKLKMSRLHNRKLIPSIFNAQISTKNKREINIYSCYLYAITEAEAIKILKHIFKNIVNMAFGQTEELIKFNIDFCYKGKEQNTKYLAPDADRAELVFKRKNKNDIDKKLITDINVSHD